MIKRFFFFIFIVSKLYAFEDSDIDGVADIDDLCPDSSFDDIVDERGCAIDSSYWGEIFLSVGVDLNFDNSEVTQDYNFLIDYSYQKLNLSLYSSKRAEDINSTTSNDIYLSIGYSMDYKSLSSKFSLGANLAKEDEYFAVLNLNYIIEKIAFLSQFEYIIKKDTTLNRYKNSFGYSLGVNYNFTDSYSMGISYFDYDSIYYGLDNYKAILFSNSYNLNEMFSIEVDYTKGLDGFSYEDIVSFKLGVAFE